MLEDCDTYFNNIKSDIFQLISNKIYNFYFFEQCLQRLIWLENIEKR